MVTNAMIQEVASCLNILHLDSNRLELWVGALASGDYKFGYGLLRSGDDEYDPFGVLAAISTPTWTWDESEEGWAADGEALFITPEQAAEWLGIAHIDHVRIRDTYQRFEQVMIRAADGGADSFEPIVRLIREAIVRGSMERRRLDQMLSDKREMMIGRGSMEYATEDRYGGHYPSFYGRR